MSTNTDQLNHAIKFQHATGEITATINADGTYRFVYLNTGEQFPCMIRTLPKNMLWFQYQQLIQSNVHHASPAIDPQQMSLGRFLYLMAKPPIHFYLPEYNWAVSPDGNMFAIQPDDRIATTNEEIAAVRSVAASIKLKHHMLSRA
jgi:hypothetical protein